MKNAIQKSAGGKRLGAGRPATGTDPARTFRLSDEFMSRVDAWAADQDDQPGRSEAVRRLVELGLDARAPRKNSTTQRSRASEMAGNELDLMADKSASVEDQATRKKRLLKGPTEFQEVRKDRKPKK